ncbi:hypothetical protein [Acrocarpospora sp. B8E8]|uniref:hypothetical protein n=1 Tax=Acrocarpospora sp. B8E8 TaxID=3153572 RepID=UPI00325D8355
MRAISLASLVALAVLSTAAPASAAALEEQFVCGSSPTPAGWTVTAWLHNASCGAGPLNPLYNWKRITRVDNLPIGSHLVMCSTQSVPNGWFAINPVTSGACQYNGGSVNAIAIRRAF